MAEKITKRPKPTQKPIHRATIPPKPDPEITPQTIKGNNPKAITKEARP